jgi:HD-GYP domain-containing protein (c-di-GMP phosphodiesterase class II)
MTARCLSAQVLVLDARPVEAERLLDEIALVCGRDKELLPQLPQAYRYAAEAAVARGDVAGAVVNCHRALESSLMVANDVEERTVVETFVEVLRLSSRCLLDTSAAAPDRARQFVARGGDIVNSLVDFLERKDWYTGHSHSRAVATLSLKLLRALVEREDDPELASLSEDTVHLAGTLHDIGKLALPWSLLNKIVPLSEGERALIRTHPERGEEILRDVGLAEIGRITAEHHEQPTGLGYPRGTRESSILGAVIAVADAFEAMTSVNRRYRTPRPLEEAVREVVAGSSIQFDPRVARALVALFERKL